MNARPWIVTLGLAILGVFSLYWANGTQADPPAELRPAGLPEQWTDDRKQLTDDQKRLRLQPASPSVRSLTLPPGALPTNPPELPPTDGATAQRMMESVKRRLSGESSPDDAALPEGLKELIDSNGSLFGDNGLTPIELDSDSPARLDAPSKRRSMDERALAAESLLKSARLLQRLGASDKKRDQLVIEMRREAVRLLSDAKN